jgi:hypothetical protein
LLNYSCEPGLEGNRREAQGLIVSLRVFTDWIRLKTQTVFEPEPKKPANRRALGVHQTRGAVWTDVVRRQKSLIVFILLS